MTENTTNFSSAYIVILKEDGTLMTHCPEPGTSFTFDLNRKATTYDIYGCSKELVSDIESQLLADRVARAIAPLLQPKDDAAELKAKLLSALSDRGIDTPQA